MLLRIAFVLFCLAGAVAPCWAQEAEPEFAMAELTPETARRAFDADLIIEAKCADAARAQAILWGPIGGAPSGGGPR